jgi:hypothetical protein
MKFPNEQSEAARFADPLRRRIRLWSAATSGLCNSTMGSFEAPAGGTI